MIQLYHTRRGPFALALVCFLAVVCVAPTASADDHEAPEPSAAPAPSVTQPIFEVSSFAIAFDRDVQPQGLSDQLLLNQPVRLTQVEGVYTVPQPGTEPAEVTLAQLSTGEVARYDVTALRAIIDDVLAYLNDEAHVVGVVVAPSPRDIDVNDLSDLRGRRTDLTIVVRVASIGQVRTLASGDRIDPDDREDSDLHQAIRDHSPLQAGDEPRTGSLIQRDQLDDYLFRLNRHPGRRVDAAVSPGDEPGEVSLDYLVAENKPWYVYFQLSNTGTPSTDRLRERFGYVNNQTTNRDDIFSVDYITAGFDESHVVTMNYSRPINEQLEMRFNGLFSTFNADQVGSPLAFTGEDAAAGAALAYTLYQDGPFFLDAVGGLEYYYTSANNPGALIEGEANLIMGNIGLEIERNTNTSRSYGYARLRGNLNEGNAADFATLGRTAPDTSFLILQYGYSVSVYLEPLLDRAAWEDISDPSTSTLAHELAFSARGQWAVNDDRLVPTFQGVAGGLNTVRGYEQAEVAGDSTLILTAEYRFHLPRVFGIEAPRRTELFDRPFRVAPESVYGRPDWDLILRAFVDYAVVDVTNELAFETDDTLFSTGIGIEIALKNNINLRGDWGIALQDAGSTQAGDSIFHFALTFVY